MSETDLVRTCEQYLSLIHVFHYRNNTGAGFMEGGRFVRFGVKGSPDIIAVKNGQYIGLECKMGSGRQSLDQKAFEEALVKAGGQYHIIRNVDDLQVIL